MYRNTQRHSALAFASYQSLKLCLASRQNSSYSEVSSKQITLSLLNSSTHFPHSNYDLLKLDKDHIMITSRT